ncbi:SGNH/GDSL hydrolase family protein [Kribbella solani]|uniref:Lysophospholipase L1-like esterase n=1 Tax=Kribbella solani TaxID=236067 RepID=A0A841DFW0_9ACTN|nr:SGNH/GDSL hydrolase family protein [Kribbella solani]MBB5977984.1 lysophospholipase L1-like esterase [Kribbella solani]MDX3006214.1 SGNH/GDSL hydrolase family protein [Kribbella solani]
MIKILRRLTTGLILIVIISALNAGDTVSEVDLAQLQTPGLVNVVALGDSVTSGTNCNCSGFPQMYADALQAKRGKPVHVDNLGVGGLDSTGLLQSLNQDDSTAEVATARASVVLLTIGANDFGDHHDDVTSGQCTSDCVADEFEQLTVNLGKILNRIHVLRDHLPTTILMTGYWNVFKDGAVAQQQYPASGRVASDQLTVRTNSAIAAAAHADDATYVDIYSPFEDDATNITALLAPDGDHPNAAGHALIAQILLNATPSHLKTTVHKG